MKKYFTLLTLFLAFFANAQIVNIPDANFKAKLLSASPSPSNQLASTETPNINGNVTTYISIDTNEDGEIQVSEAQAIKWLSIHSSNITDFNGIEYFTNLEYLDCRFNQLTSLILNQNLNLVYLYCDDNQITNLDISQNDNLQLLSCPSNQLTNLDVSQNINLLYLYCLGNQLTNLVVSQNLNLEFLSCSYNSLTNLDVSQNLNLLNIYCEENQLTNLDVSQNVNLINLYCDLNQLTNIDVTQNLNLELLSCSNNLLTNLDVSQNMNLYGLYCANNQLESLNLKNNNIIWSGLNFPNNPNLQYICADEEDVLFVQQVIDNNGYSSTCHVNSYCSFNPNGNYNTISGTALYDNETDGCDANDEDFQFLRINMTDGTNSGSTFTNFEGDYVFYGNDGTFTLTPQLENPTYFNVSPASAQFTFVDNNNNIASQDFCITPNGVHNDLEVVLAQVTPARPGFDAEYSLVYKNKGNLPLSGAVSVTYEDDKLDFVSATQTPTTTVTGLLSWDYTNLLPFENRSITFTLNVNAPTEIPAVNNGDILGFVATITPLAGDEIPADNTYTFNQTVVGSYDPNDIYCLEGENVDPSMIGEYLHYNVRFENTGTFAAENVVVATTIDATQYDINTLQVLNASNNVYTRITGNLVEFIFENIQLAPSGVGSGGHGNILFKMKSLNTLQTNDEVTSNANIFFDYNFPIETNDATTVFETLSNQDFTKDNSVRVYPNPAKETVTISAQSNVSSITIYDAQGRIVQFSKANALETTIDLNKLTSGIYIIDITTENGRSIEKLMKK